MSETNVNHQRHEKSQGDVRPAGEDFASRLIEFFRTLETDRRRSAEVLERLNQFIESGQNADHLQQVVAGLHDECRQHRERFYDREVLLPLLRGVINVIDRASGEIKSLKGLRGNSLDAGRRWKEVVDYYISARRADRLELGNLLARYGVDCYRCPENQFNSRMQKCVKITPTHKKKREGLIAGRMRPGYRREEVIVRPEWVDVYMFKGQSLARKEKLV